MCRQCLLGTLHRRRPAAGLRTWSSKRLSHLATAPRQDSGPIGSLRSPLSELPSRAPGPRPLRTALVQVAGRWCGRGEPSDRDACSRSGRAWESTPMPPLAPWPGAGVMLLLPIHRGGGGNLNASRSSQQQPRPHGNPVLRELVAMDTLPRVPACQPPSPSQPPESAPACVSPRGGRGQGGLADSWAPAPGRAQAGGQAPETAPSAGRCRALSRSCLRTAHLPGPPLGSPAHLLSHRPGRGQEGLPGANRAPRSDPAAPPRTAVHPGRPGVHGAPFLGLGPLSAKAEVAARLPGCCHGNNIRTDTYTVGALGSGTGCGVRG